jgi:tRNA (cytidine/uridine-2'-O-)-methyltransferase
MPQSFLTQPLLHIVLDRPRIAANVASIVRLATGTGCAVHICGPLVFDQGDKTKWRAGLDYFFGARVHFHRSLSRCLDLLHKAPYIIEVGSRKAPWDVPLSRGDVVIFGPETQSVQEEIQVQYADRILTLPQVGPVRSLNLAQCVAVIAFEATRQITHAGVAPN